MADIVLSPLVQVVLEKLATPLVEEIANRCGIRSEVKKLWRTLRSIQALLQDAEEQQLTDKFVKIWLGELQDVAYDMEDLLDDFSPEALLSSASTETRFAQQLRNFVPSLSEFLSSLNMLPRMIQIRETLEYLAHERSNFHLRARDVNTSWRSRRGRRTGFCVVDSEVFGRGEDKERIMELLLLSGSNPCHGDIPVISIVGIGGLGKTTLAQYVYNDDRVAGYFGMKMWVCVNDDFDVEKVMMSIIESAGNVKCDFSIMDRLQFRLQELLFGKRFLLVLDDVWNEDDNEWNKLRTSLRGGLAGSRIIVTTRSKKVASVMGTTHIHPLEGLSDEDCWALFHKRAFRDHENASASLISVGKQIVKKCGGVPLAAMTLGSLMRLKRDEREWLLVKESDIWHLDSPNESDIMPALRLSYSHLPSHLKACFAFCSIFPKNYNIKKDKLIQLWIAAGMIQSPEGRRSLEFIGGEYFDDLRWIFFFQETQNVDSGGVVECKMHNLIHDLAQSVAGVEFAALENDRRMPEIFSQVRHSLVVCNFSSCIIPETFYEAKKLRTLVLLLPKGDLGELPQNVFSSFRYLRVLDLSSSGMKKLNESISLFIFLRYLDLSNTHVKDLPQSVCCLCRLQMLNLSDCYDLIELPNDLTRLPNLRHLMIGGCDRLTKIPAFIGKLVFLQTLSMFIVGTRVGESISELGLLNLGGDLSIRKLESVSAAEEVRNADLKGKRNLQSLDLSWWNNHNNFQCSSANTSSAMAEQVLDYLQPHEYLRKLSIRGYQGTHFPRWMNFLKLPNITELRLISCRRCENLPMLGHLPFLKVLHLQDMDAVKIIGIQFYGDVAEAFPSLKELILADFPLLESWWSFNRREDFPSLSKLIINRCPRLRSIPCFPLLKHLELRNCSNEILQSASTLTLLSILVIDEFTALDFPENLFLSNTLLMSLVISSCRKLCSIPSSVAMLINLKSLTIRWCDELQSLPHGLQDLFFLESLEIVECHSLVSLPEDIQGLRTLRSLSIENCNGLKCLPLGLQYLASLEQLTIMYCPQLATLPEELQHLCSLRSLSILNLPMLVYLPDGLESVTTLQTLEIRGCQGLKALPDWLPSLVSLRSLALSECYSLRSLPNGLQHLISLQHLSIRECPDLEESCRKDIGADWTKIQHLAHVYIGSKESRNFNAANSSSC